MNLRFHHFVSGMKEGGESKISLCYARGSGASPEPCRKPDRVI